MQPDLRPHRQLLSLFSVKFEIKSSFILWALSFSSNLICIKEDYLQRIGFFSTKSQHFLDQRIG